MEYKPGELVLAIATGKIHTVTAVSPDGLSLTISDCGTDAEVSVNDVEKVDSTEGGSQKEFSDPRSDAAN